MWGLIRAWFYPDATALPPGHRSLRAAPHRRTAVLLRGRSAVAVPHRRTASPT